MDGQLADIVMYSKPLCGYCAAAKRLLQHKGLPFSEISLFLDPGRQTEMVQRSGRRTVPQIFIDETHVGGFDDLRDLDRRGELDRLVARAGPTETTGD